MAKLQLSLVENIITLLTYSDEAGRIISNLVDVNLFEGEHALIAERALAYWKRYNCAPGSHLGDELADIFEGNDPRQQSLRMILSQMSRLAPSINTSYVIDKLKAFTRLQSMKSAIFAAAESLQNDDEQSIGEVEEILGNLLRARELSFGSGMSLEDADQALAYMRDVGNHFSTNIEPLDRAGIGPKRGTLLCLIAPTGLGKSWGCVHIGRNALRRRLRVVHISLEMSEEEVLLRYYQNFFAIPKHQAMRIYTTSFDIEKASRRLVEHERQEVNFDFAFDSREINLELRNHLRQLGGITRNLKIKRFAPHRLTVGGIEAYLDTLEATENFIPDMLIVDYPKLMKLDPVNLRVSMGMTVEGIRGLTVERNLAGVMVHQASRSGAKSRMVMSTDVAEDWSVVHTCDVVMTLSASPRERRLGISRLFVAKARNDRDRFAVLLVQNYEIGQFAINAFALPGNYDDYIAHIQEEDDNEDDDHATD